MGSRSLLFDLLTPAEESQRTNVFDVELLGDRLVRTTGWLLDQPPAAGLRPGLFGASTGAAAALAAAAQLGPLIRAVVSRGGRPDLAHAHLSRVVSPTLLVVGGDDAAVLDLNRRSYDRLTCPRRLAVVRGATHLFEESGALERVAQLAGDWLAEHLAGGPEREAAALAETVTVDPVPVP